MTQGVQISHKDSKVVWELVACSLQVRDFVTVEMSEQT